METATAIGERILADRMNDNEFKLLRDLIHKECGICLKDDKKDFLVSRIERKLKELNIPNYFSYYRRLTEHGNREELASFIDAVTVNETSFFRNQHQYELFCGKILPEIIAGKRKNRQYRLNIWSAGCATGEEPYSIAMAVLDALPDLGNWTVKITASDISLRCLDKANKGVYIKDKIVNIPGRFSRHFNVTGAYCEVKDYVKKLVVFDFHNLMHDNGLSGMDVIFCKNVMIYFEQERRNKLLDRFDRVLVPGGYLFLGHADTLNGTTVSEKFKFIYDNKGTAYRKAAK